MKRVTVILFFFLTALYSFSQETMQNENCQNNESVKEVVRATDSLQRMIKKLKSSLTISQWSDFYQNIKEGVGLNSFDKCGIYSREYKSEYLAIGSEIDRTLRKLKNLVDPNNSLTGDELRNRMNTEFNCYFNNDVENTLVSLRSSAGLPVLERLAGGPCEISMRTCMRDEKRNYNGALRECAGIGLGAAGLLGGWWGLGSGMACAIGAGNDYFDGVLTCAANYCDCTNCSN